jgi:hypothetical protein
MQLRAAVAPAGGPLRAPGARSGTAGPAGACRWDGGSGSLPCFAPGRCGDAGRWPAPAAPPRGARRSSRRATRARPPPTRRSPSPTPRRPALPLRACALPRPRPNAAWRPARAPCPAAAAPRRPPPASQPQPQPPRGPHAPAAAAAAGASPLGGGGSSGGGSLNGVPALLAGVPLFGPMAVALAAYVQRVRGLWRAFLPMLSLFFLLSFVNTLLDSLKDTLVITAAGGGAAVIPFLTVYAVLPSSLLFLLAYSWASQRMGRAALFNATVAGFGAFFAAFALFFMPNAETLHLHALADGLQQVRTGARRGAGGLRTRRRPQPPLRCSARESSSMDGRSRRRQCGARAYPAAPPPPTRHPPRPPPLPPLRSRSPRASRVASA